MNRQSNIKSELDQLTKHHTSVDKSKERNHTPKVKCCSNKYLLNSSTKQNLNRSYNSNQKVHSKLQSKATSDIKQKLLDEILRGSHSQFSQSYLTSIIQDKIVNKPQKYHTTDDTSSFTLPEKEFNIKTPFLQIDIFTAEECKKQQDSITITKFQELLEQLELKEVELKVNVFSNLKTLFLILAKQIQQKLASQMNEITKLQNFNTELQQQQKILQDRIQEQKQITIKTEETLNSLLFTLRYTNLNNPQIIEQHTDQVETQKHQSDNKNFEENISMMSEESAPFGKFYNYYIKKQQDPQNKRALGLTLNLNSLKNPQTAPIGYQEEFMANLNEFSESWRQQAIKEQRF
ncbi:unnamed protein product [Paramecium pentaurelia]|uniref:Uncharacterized protein n=1 Tax=Paramecium pentaurelia TaxID=43138 RepID=A0A8S1V2F5_9CILI|nr:unnamed protein product [Paramecium pentaurelia]